MQQTTQHIPVMFDLVLSYLQAAEGGTFLDCTLGGAGHTEGILKANPQNRVTATDRDERALDRAKVRLADFGDRVSLEHRSFSQLDGLSEEPRYDGMLADLGISTDQLVEERGFSFRDTTPLDMRMNESDSISAHEIVNDMPERELYILLREGGVGPEAKMIARSIVRARPIEKTDQLAEIIADSLGGRYRGKEGHPATVVFQALRMSVNAEHAELSALLKHAPRLVKSGGRFVVITFHSIEDKVVTNRMRLWQSGGEFSALSPGSMIHKVIGKMVERKAIAPSEDEILANPSARSARLRIFQFA